MKFIFEIAIKPGCSEADYVSAWERGSRIIQKEPGAMGTRLHRRIGEPGKLLAIASWESKDARVAAIKRLRSNPETKAIIDYHEQFAAFRVIGEFDEAQWSVWPE